MKPLVYDRWYLGQKIALSAFLAGVGVVLYFLTRASGWPVAATVLCALAPFPLILLACAWQVKLAIVPGEQKYLIYRGLWPFAKPHVGPVSDFLDLRFYRGVNDGGAKAYTYHGLELRFAEPHRAPIDLCGEGSRKEVIDCALEFVQATGVPVVEDTDAAEEDGDAGSLVAEVEARLQGA